MFPSSRRGNHAWICWEFLQSFLPRSRHSWIGFDGNDEDAILTRNPPSIEAISVDGASSDTK